MAPGTALVIPILSIYLSIYLFAYLSIYLQYIAKRTEVKTDPLYLSIYLSESIYLASQLMWFLFSLNFLQGEEINKNSNSTSNSNSNSNSNNRGGEIRANNTAILDLKLGK